MAMHAVSDGTGFEMNYEVIPGILPQNTLFIHGNLASNRWWYPAEKEWSRKAKGQNLPGMMILAEFRGCGQSMAPRDEAEINMHRFADDYISLVEKLNLAPLNLVGHSTGGLIVTLMLAKAPQLFQKAVLLDPVGAKGVKFDDSMNTAFEQMKVDKDLVALVMASTIHNNDPTSDFFRQIVVEDAFQAVRTVGAGVVKSLSDFNIEHECSKVAHPVLVLHGEHDQLLPMADSQALADLMTNARFAVVPGQGHCTNAENPKLFTETVDQFFLNS